MGLEPLLRIIPINGEDTPMAKAPKTQKLDEDLQQPDVQETVDGFDAPEDGGPRTDNFQKTPNSPVPGGMPTFEPSLQPGQTNIDPLGVGKPTSAIADPTDTRAIGIQSALGVTVDNASKGEDRPTHSPSFAGMVVSAGGITTPEDAAASAGGVMPATKLVYFENARVRLLKPHYINNLYYDEGAIIDGYSGPANKDMELVDKNLKPV